MTIKDIRYIMLRASAGLAMAPPLLFYGDMLVNSLGISVSTDWINTMLSIIFGMALALWFVMSRTTDPCHSWRLWFIAVSAWVVGIGGYLIWGVVLFIKINLSFGDSAVLNLIKLVIVLFVSNQLMLMLVATCVSIVFWFWLRGRLSNCLRAKPSP